MQKLFGSEDNIHIAILSLKMLGKANANYTLATGGPRTDMHSLGLASLANKGVSKAPLIATESDPSSIPITALGAYFSITPGG